MKNDFAKFLSDFFGKFLPNERGLSPNTIKAYSQAFTLLIKYLYQSEKIQPNQIKLADLTKERIQRFLDWLEAEKKVSVSSRNARLVAIHAFVRYLQYNDVKSLARWQDILSIKPKKASVRPMTYLTEDAMRLIMSQPDIETRTGFRDYILLGLLYDSAARVQELIDLTPSDIRFGEISTIKLFGKGSKIRHVPLSPPQASNLRKYLDKTGLTESSRLYTPLFPNPQGNKLSRMAILNIVKKYADMARQIDASIIPDNIGCHTFRHSKAMHMLDAEINLVDIRDFLGHVSSTTTEIYARTNEKRKIKALQKMNPTLIVEGKSSWQRDDALLEYLKGLQYNR